MSDYFHESMVAKMVSSNEYQQGYSVGFASGYKQGKTDRDREIVEHSVFFSNRPIEDIVLEARADERAKVLDEVVTTLEDELYTFVDNDYCTSDGSLMWKCDEVRKVIGKLKEQTGEGRKVD